METLSIFELLKCFIFRVGRRLPTHEFIFYGLLVKRDVFIFKSQTALQTPFTITCEYDTSFYYLSGSVLFILKELF